MKPGYFHNCTLFAQYRAGDEIHTRMEFVSVPQTNPRYFFDWVIKCKKDVAKETGEMVATLDIKVIHPHEGEYFEICKQ